MVHTHSNAAAAWAQAGRSIPCYRTTQGASKEQVKVLFELMEQCGELERSTMVCSQREPSSRKSMMMNDEVVANAITKHVTKRYTIVIQPRD